MAQVNGNYTGDRLPGGLYDHEVQGAAEEPIPLAVSESVKTVKSGSLRRSIEDHLEKRKLEALIEDYSFSDEDDDLP